VYILAHWKTSRNVDHYDHARFHAAQHSLDEKNDDESVSDCLQDKAQGTEEEKEKAAKQFADINHGA
jgi:hypothetical protein